MSPFAGWPLFGGVAVRIYHLLKALCRHHEVWFVCRQGQAPVGVGCHPVASSASRYRQLFDPYLVGRLCRLIRQERIEAGVFSSLLTGLHGPLIRAVAGIPVVFDNHNVEHLQSRRSGQPWWPLLKALEWFVTRSVDHVTCVSEVDRELHEACFGLNKAAVTVYSNGAEIGRPVAPAKVTRKQLGLPDGPLVLFFGVMKYWPNAEAATVLRHELLPRWKGSPVKVVVAGLGSQELEPDDHLIRLGFVEDIASLIEACDVVVAPLLSGSGTRLKILESVAQRRPVVSTTVGAEGLERFRLGAYLTVADGWDAFASAVLALLKNPVTAPLPKAFSAYDWESLFEGFVEQTCGLS